MKALTYQEYRDLRRFPALDGLRAIAALLVIAHHFGGLKWNWVNGRLGVPIFFVLSGFLITTLLLREEEKYGKVSLRAFYLRRAFRILPVYYIVIAMPLVLWGQFEHFRPVELGPALPYYLVFFNEFAPFTGFAHTWTLGYEQKFYLFWPLIGFALMPLIRSRKIVTPILVVSLLIATAFFRPEDAPQFVSASPYAGLLTGCLLAMVLHSRRGFAALAFLTRPIVSIIAAGGFLAVHLTLGRVEAVAGRGIVDAYFPLAVAIFLPSLLGSGWIARLLATRPMVITGERSYSIYLVQVMAGLVAAPLLPPGMPQGTRLALLTAVISFLIADLLYRWVEKPMIDVGRKFASRSRTVEVPSPPAEPDREDSQPQVLVTTS